MNDNLWARRGHERHRELYDEEYAKQLERIARIRSEVSAALPHAPPPPPPSPPEPASPPGRAAPRWDAAPTNLAPPLRRAATTPRRDDPPPPPAVAPATLLPRDDAPSPPPPDAPATLRRVWLQPTPTADPIEGDVAARPDDAAPAGVRAPRPPDEESRGEPAAHAPGHRHLVRWRPRRRSARWAAAVTLAVAAAGGTAMLAARTAQAPAATVFRVPGQPTGLAAAGGRVWVAGPMAGEVWVLDGASGRPAAPPLRVGGSPARLALDGRFAWIADTERGGVVGAPVAGRGALRRLPTGPDVADVAVAAGAVWTASSADGTIRVSDPDGRRQVLHVGARPVALAADERRVVAADAAGAIIRLSTRSRRPEGPAVPVGGAPSDIALDGDRAWIADAQAGTVQAVVISSGSAGPAIPVGRTPVAIAVDERGVYVLCRGDRTLVRLDASTGAVRSRTHLTHSPTALALDPRHIWIAAGDHEVIRVDR